MKKRLFFKRCVVVFVLITISFVSLSADDHGAPHWSYKGPMGCEHWGDLSSKWSVAKTGKRQSPINIKGVIESKFPSIEVDYRETKLKILNNGHTIQVNYTEDSYARIGNKNFKLLQFHFHSPSENIVKGKPYPMEIHLVHKSDDGQLAVIGVFCKIGKQNPFLQKLWDKLPSKVGKEKTTDELINAKSILPKDGSFVHFNGSLTTPPCSEGVSWNVCTSPIEVSKTQVEKFLAIIGENARPVQPLHNRMIVSGGTGEFIFKKIKSSTENNAAKTKKKD